MLHHVEIFALQFSSWGHKESYCSAALDSFIRAPLTSRASTERLLALQVPKAGYKQGPFALRNFWLAFC